MSDNRTNGQIVAKALVAHCEDHKMPVPRGSVKKIVEALRVAGRLAGEPTEAQVEAAAKIIRRASLKTTADPGDFWSDCYEAEREVWRAGARAALVAAAGVAPQVESEHEYLLKARALHQTNSGLPSSTVDEGKIANEMERHRHVMVAPGPHRCSCGFVMSENPGFSGWAREHKLHVARVVVEAIRGEGR